MLSNQAIRSADATHVRFRYRRSEDGQPRTCSLPPHEFLRRFLQHVLPKGFVKLRYYGLHHPRHRARLALLRAALHLHAGQPLPPEPEPSPTPPCLCPSCRTPMRRIAHLKPQPLCPVAPPTGPPS
jgi:hypothetical protein